MNKRPDGPKHRTTEQNICLILRECDDDNDDDEENGFNTQ